MYIENEKNRPVIQSDGIEPRGVVVTPVTVAINANFGINANVYMNANAITNANANVVANANGGFNCNLTTNRF